MLSSSANGFSLVELLLALLILGNISAFAIPKVLNAQQTSSKKAVLRETIAALSNVQREGMLTGELVVSAHRAYFDKKLNYIKRCDNALADGCWSAAVVADSGEPGYILPNGAFLTGVNNSGDNHGGNRWANVWTIDWNGHHPPNLVGEDVVKIAYCFGSADCSGAAAYLPPNLTPGRMGPVVDASNEALYYDIFSR